MIKLTDEEFFEWCGSHKVKGCGGTRLTEGCEREVSLCEDCRANAQLKKVVEWGDFFCVEYDHYGSDKRANTRQRECHKCWQALKKEAGL